jgi:hypothetical protein
MIEPLTMTGTPFLNLLGMLEHYIVIQSHAFQRTCDLKDVLTLTATSS